MSHWISASINQRTNECLKFINEPAHQWIDESVNQWMCELDWISGLMNQCTSIFYEWVTLLVDEPMNQWIGESMVAWTAAWSKWFNDSVSGWFNESMGQWISELEIRWINESMNQRMNGWMEEWMDGWVSCLYFFADLLLYWATFSLRYLFSKLPLFWAASYLRYFFSDPALSCLTATYSVASATEFFSLRSCYNAFSNLQLQSRIAQE
jgi:hypothetical protein